MKKQFPSGKLTSEEIQSLYYDLVETSQDLIWQCDAEGRYIYLNPAWETTFGYSIEEMIGRKFTDFQSPEYVERDLREFSRLLAGGTVKGYETVHLSKSGKEIHLVFNAKFVHDSNGVIAGTRGTAYDITDRKKVEEELRASEERFNLFLEHSPIYVFFKDENIRPVRLSRNFEQMLGMPLEKVIGKTMDELFPSEMAKKMIEDDLTVLKSGKSIEVIETFNGRTYSTIKFPVKRIGFPHFLAGFTIDITERVQFEEALRKSEQKLRLLFENMTVGFALHEMIYDRNGAPLDYRFLEINPAFEKLTGMVAKNIIGKTVKEAMPNTEQHWIDTYGKVAKSGIPVAYENFSQELGKHYNVWAFSPSKDKFAVIFSDVTEIKKAEAVLQNAQKLESLGVLAGGIAHDFNNLLSGIFGYIESAKNKTEEEKVKNILNNALNVMDRAKNLTMQLLTFSKGGSPMKKKQPFTNLLQETARFALSGSQIDCIFDIQYDLWTGTFDENQISQVVDNIIINAQQAMPNGGSIYLSAKNTVLKDGDHVSLLPGNYVKISIKDSGIGIPKNFLSRIFEPFYTTKQNGHGLGLATSFSIIKRHDGFIDVESEPGNGTVFHIYLPALPDTTISENRKLSSDHRGSGTFIIMDDEEFFRDTTGEMLTSFGYNVAFMKDGKEAVDFFKEELAKNRKVAGLIFDLTIPGGMGGKEAVLEIRKICKNTPVFVTSGYAEDPVMAYPADYGFTACLGKPYRINELIDLLNTHMQ